MREASAIVLAGGRSERMGQPKAMLRFGEKTLLEVIVGRLLKSFPEVVVVAGAEGGPDSSRSPTRPARGSSTTRSRSRARCPRSSSASTSAWVIRPLSAPATCRC